MNLLVASADRIDAGKTTFATGLVAYTDGVGFKPQAGNDYWHHHDKVRETLAEGRLYGKDATRLAAASAADVTPESINPVHRLWRPRPGRGQGVLGQTDRDFVVDRVGDRYVVNEAVEIPDTVSEQLPLADAQRVDSLDAFNRVMARDHVAAQQDLLARVHDRDRAVVESYAETARPLPAFEPDAVAVVDPGRARLYDGDRYVKGCQVASGSPQGGQLEERVESVTELIEPKASVSLPPLTDDEQADPETVAEAYEHAYDGLLAVAFE